MQLNAIFLKKGVWLIFKNSIKCNFVDKLQLNAILKKKVFG